MEESPPPYTHIISEELPPYKSITLIPDISEYRVDEQRNVCYIRFHYSWEEENIMEIVFRPPKEGLLKLHNKNKISLNSKVLGCRMTLNPTSRDRIIRDLDLRCKYIELYKFINISYIVRPRDNLDKYKTCIILFATEGVN